jgi:hypothetical protein
MPGFAREKPSAEFDLRRFGDAVEARAGTAKRQMIAENHKST